MLIYLRNLDSAAIDKPDITEIKTSIRVSKHITNAVVGKKKRTERKKKKKLSKNKDKVTHTYVILVASYLFNVAFTHYFVLSS